MSYAVDPGTRPAVTISGSDDTFPVRRIFCVGRNYAAHSREMGFNPDREAPFFFTKPADAIVANGTDIPYPSQTANLHHEIELVVAIGKRADKVAVEAANDHIFGYAVGNDLTRRDLQVAAREKGRPWDTGKAFDNSAPISAIHTVAETGHPTAARIWLSVNGEMRQEGNTDELIWSVPEVISILSGLYVLEPGDLIYTGTPAGVGAIIAGDRIEGGVDGIDTLANTII